MLGEHFRPWGEARWFLGKCLGRKWGFLGCLGTEDRTFTAGQILADLGVLSRTFYIKVVDPPSRYTGDVQRRLATHEAKLASLSMPKLQSETMQLFERLQGIADFIRQFVSDAGPSIVLDISTFPKRFFFPMIKFIMKNSSGIQDLVVTYTLPEGHSDEALSENPEPWACLPGYLPEVSPEPAFDVGIVGVGFVPMGLPELFANEYKNVEIKLLFPFPPGPPSFNRSWAFIDEIERRLPAETVSSPIRIEAIDVSDTFDHICAATDNKKKYAFFAPYGPKPMSLAMCLYASLSGAPVFYTQPKAYNPAYSKGVGTTYAYSVILNGRLCYEIP